MESFSDAYDCRPPPIFIPLITAAEIAVFLYYALEPASRAKWPVTASSGCPMDSPLLYDPRKRWEAWRFLSYMLLHNGYIHLIFNCLVQLILGVLLELVHKLWRVGPVYLLVWSRFARQLLLRSAHRSGWRLGRLLRFDWRAFCQRAAELGGDAARLAEESRQFLRQRRVP
ncbi:hypothetical protein BOX15_Mlig030849g2, partial [Macrostomum lignano]